MIEADFGGLFHELFDGKISVVLCESWHSFKFSASAVLAEYASLISDHFCKPQSVMSGAIPLS